MPNYRKDSDAISKLSPEQYCINSAALRFIHRDDMQAQGYGAYLNLVNTDE